MPEKASRPITALRNLGPAMAEAFGKVGLHTAEELSSLGADASYARLISSGHRAHFMAYVALAMGLQGRPWNDCDKAEKAALRARFDTIVAQAHSSEADHSHAFEAALDASGVRASAPRRSKTKKAADPKVRRP